MESFLCKKCKQLLSPMTKIQFYDHIRTCKGIDPNEPLGVTFMKWPPSPSHLDTSPPALVIEPVILKVRPQTRG